MGELIQFPARKRNTTSISFKLFASGVLLVFVAVFIAIAETIYFGSRPFSSKAVAAFATPGFTGAAMFLLIILKSTSE